MQNIVAINCSTIVTTFSCTNNEMHSATKLTTLPLNVMILNSCCRIGNLWEKYFCLNSDSEGSNCKKVIKNFPQLEEYTHYLKESARYFNSAPDCCLCSFKKDKDGNIVKYMNPDHKEDFDALLKRFSGNMESIR